MPDGPRIYVYNKKEAKGMKIFEKNGKVNFVDENNVFVGFDYQQCCCEDFGWSISNAEGVIYADDNGHDLRDFPDYYFDTDYFLEGDDPSDYDSGGWVKFRLVEEDGEDLFLMLYNIHNGYYSHGFGMEVGGERLYYGSI